MGVDGDVFSLPQSDFYEFDKMYTDGEFYKWANRETRKDYPMRVEMRDLLIKLASPHGKTIAKMYRIKKGLES